MAMVDVGAHGAWPAAVSNALGTLSRQGWACQMACMPIDTHAHAPEDEPVGTGHVFMFSRLEYWVTFRDSPHQP